MFVKNRISYSNHSKLLNFFLGLAFEEKFKGFPAPIGFVMEIRTGHIYTLGVDHYNDYCDFDLHKYVYIISLCYLWYQQFAWRCELNNYIHIRFVKWNIKWTNKHKYIYTIWSYKYVCFVCIHNSALSTIFQFQELPVTHELQPRNYLYINRLIHCLVFKVIVFYYRSLNTCIIPLCIRFVVSSIVHTYTNEIWPKRVFVHHK